jgi:hypothetical protein
MVRFLFSLLFGTGHPFCMVQNDIIEEHGYPVYLPIIVGWTGENICSLGCTSSNNYGNIQSGGLQLCRGLRLLLDILQVAAKGKTQGQSLAM